MTPEGKLDTEALDDWSTALVQTVWQRLEQKEAQQQRIRQKEEPPRR